jgi:hypothetical protein
MIVVLGLLAGCARRPLLDRAIAARGGALPSVVIGAEARVHAGAPGTWQYTRAYRSPDRYAWRIVTADEPLSHLFDGRLVRCFVGGAEVSCDPSPDAPLRTHARWTAVVNLDALRAPGVTLEPLAARDLPDGVREGFSASFAEGATYRLGFDERTLLVWAAGPLDLSPFAKGDAAARFADYRRTGGLLLPFAVTYWVAESRIADEKILAYCVEPAALTEESFADPERLPDCP